MPFHCHALYYSVIGCATDVDARGPTPVKAPDTRSIYLSIHLSPETNVTPSPASRSPEMVLMDSMTDFRCAFFRLTFLLSQIFVELFSLVLFFVVHVLVRSVFSVLPFVFSTFFRLSSFMYIFCPFIFSYRTFSADFLPFVYFSVCFFVLAFLRMHIFSSRADFRLGYFSCVYFSVRTYISSFTHIFACACIFSSRIFCKCRIFRLFIFPFFFLQFLIFSLL